MQLQIQVLEIRQREFQDRIVAEGGLWEGVQICSIFGLVTQGLEGRKVVEQQINRTELYFGYISGGNSESSPLSMGSLLFI